MVAKLTVLPGTLLELSCGQPRCQSTTFPNRAPFSTYRSNLKIIKLQRSTTVRESTHAYYEITVAFTRDPHVDQFSPGAGRRVAAVIQRARRPELTDGQRVVLSHFAERVRGAGDAAFVCGVVGGLDARLEGTRVVGFVGEVVARGGGEDVRRGTCGVLCVEVSGRWYGRMGEMEDVRR